jgi:predicted RNA-binding protein with PIN domain
MRYSASVAKKVFIFDGYNLLYADPITRKMLDEDLSAARDQLINQILNFIGQNQPAQGYLVFDGPQEFFSRDTYSSELEIFFGKPADLIIEKLGKTLAPEIELTLVSSDNTVFTGVLARPGLVKRISDKEFWQRVKKIQRTYRSEKNEHFPLYKVLGETIFKKLDELRR